MTNHKTQFEQVREFQKTFELPAPDTPTILNEETVLNRAGWTTEEIVELLWSTSDNEKQFARMFNELIERMKKDFIRMKDKGFEPENKLVNQADSLVDQLYFVNGSLVEMSIIPDVLFNIVHQANMNKLHDGKVVRNEHGKVIKPKNWQAPEPLLEENIRNQVKESYNRFE